MTSRLVEQASERMHELFSEVGTFDGGAHTAPRPPKTDVHSEPVIVTLFGHRVFTDVLKLKSYLMRVGHIHPTSTWGRDPNPKAGPEGRLCGGNEHRSPHL